jgi:ankyrin repeat protein
MNSVRYISLIFLIACSALIANAQSRQSEAALRKAAQDGDIKAVNALLAKGTNVNARDETGKTALLWVAPARDNPEMVQDLISQGADVNATDKNGETALMIAASQDNPGIIEELLAAGAKVNAANNVGQTALMEAAFRANIEIVKTLLAHGADLKLKDKKGRAAFEVANEGSANYHDPVMKKRFAETLELLRISR